MTEKTAIPRAAPPPLCVVPLLFGHQQRKPGSPSPRLTLALPSLSSPTAHSKGQAALLRAALGSRPRGSLCAANVLQLRSFPRGFTVRFLRRYLDLDLFCRDISHCADSPLCLSRRSSARPSFPWNPPRVKVSHLYTRVSLF
jgi:hypothetical protein